MKKIVYMCGSVGLVGIIVTVIAVNTSLVRSEIYSPAEKQENVVAVSDNPTNLSGSSPQAENKATMEVVKSIPKPRANEARVVIRETQFGFDPKDTLQLVSNVNNVFVGTVLEKVGEKQIGEFSYPVFSVQVSGNIKGEASGVVRIVQSDIGYRNGVAYVSSNDIKSADGLKTDDLLLKPAATYVFAALYVKSDAQYGISAAPYDREFITAEKLGAAKLWDLASENKRVQELRQATDALGQTYQFHESFQ